MGCEDPGVRLNATVVKPKQANSSWPVIFTLTPYIADSYLDRAPYSPGTATPSQLEKNYNGEGVMAAEGAKDARTALIRILHDKAYLSQIQLPIGRAELIAGGCLYEATRDLWQPSFSAVRF